MASAKSTNYIKWDEYFMGVALLSSMRSKDRINNSKNFLENKYPYVVHAEPNAILNANSSLENCTLYVSLFPCNECAKLIIQSGIKEIVYMDDKYDGTESDIASKKMLDAAKIKYRKMNKIVVTLDNSL